MISSREIFLQKVQDALQIRGARAPKVENRGTIGYQGAGPDPVARFCEQFSAAGGFPHSVCDAYTAVSEILKVIQEKSARQVLLGRGPFLDPLELPARLRSQGVEVTIVDTVTPETSRGPFFGADLGISGVDYLIAETGTISLCSKTEDARSLSLLPLIHIAVAHRSQIVPDLFDLFDLLGDMPSCLSLITGPSKTGDIELKLVTGVHGPGEVHVVLLAG